MRVRFANRDDCTAIAEVHVASWRTTYRGQVPDEQLNQLSVPDRSERWRQALAQAKSHAIVAEEHDRIVGFVSFGECRDQDVEARTGEVYAIYLLSEFQGLGIGRSLWSKAIKELKTSGFDSVVVWVLDTNASARAFYEGMGCSLDGKSKVDQIGGKEVVKLRYRTDTGTC